MFTGFRWENRFRVLKHEHFINPVLYIEYENTSGADKILKEVEGHDVESDYADRNAVLRQDHGHELEFKLLLSGTHKGWNFTQNTIATKNLSNEPWEFGYAIGASRPLALKASAKRCSFCRQNFIVGARCTAGWEIATVSASTILRTTWLPWLPGICLRIGRCDSPRDLA